MRDGAPAAVLWDMDGTLVDTEPYWIEEERLLVEAHGGTWSVEDALQLVGSDLTVSAHVLRDQGGVDLPPERIVDHGRGVQAHPGGGLEVVGEHPPGLGQGAADQLQRLLVAPGGPVAGHQGALGGDPVRFGVDQGAVHVPQHRGGQGALAGARPGGGGGGRAARLGRGGRAVGRHRHRSLGLTRA